VWVSHPPIAEEAVEQRLVTKKLPVHACCGLCVDRYSESCLLTFAPGRSTSTPELNMVALGTVLLTPLACCHDAATAAIHPSDNGISRRGSGRARKKICGNVNVSIVNPHRGLRSEWPERQTRAYRREQTADSRADSR
jgi:hypothetical protein